VLFKCSVWTLLNVEVRNVSVWVGVHVHLQYVCVHCVAVYDVFGCELVAGDGVVEC
jgi:hypothetical protein